MQDCVSAGERAGDRGGHLPLLRGAWRAAWPLCVSPLGRAFILRRKWFLQKIGPSGLVKLLAAFDNRRAYAQCIFSYTESAGSAPILFIGKTQGLIVEEARGTARFGWDSIFEPEGFSKTYAEMTAEEKNSISHRRRSMDQLKAFLRDSLKIIS